MDFGISTVSSDSENDSEIEKFGHVIDGFLRKNDFTKKFQFGEIDFSRNSSIRWPQFSDFWLIFYSESDDMVKIPKSKLFRIHKNKVWNQPKWTYLCSGNFIAIFDNFISDSACEKLRFTIF